MTGWLVLRHINPCWLFYAEVSLTIMFSKIVSSRLFEVFFNCCSINVVQNYFKYYLVIVGVMWIFYILRWKFEYLLSPDILSNKDLKALMRGHLPPLCSKNQPLNVFLMFCSVFPSLVTLSLIKRL